MEIYVVTKDFDLQWSDRGMCKKNVTAFTKKSDAIQYMKKRTLHHLLKKYGETYYRTITKVYWDSIKRRYHIWNDNDRSYFIPNFYISPYTYNVISLHSHKNKAKIAQ